MHASRQACQARSRPLRWFHLTVALLATWTFGCITPYEAGSNLYREGDLRGALDTWKEIGPNETDYRVAREQIEVVEAEFGRLLRRYEKRGEFYESEGRLAEALLSYRLALKLDPEQTALLRRVQRLVRQLDETEREALDRMRARLAAGELRLAGDDARELERLNPFSPRLQVDIRQVRAALGEKIFEYLEAGKASYRRSPDLAKRKFQQVLELDPGNEAARGYLSYIADRAQPKGPSKLNDDTRAALPELTDAQIIAEGHFSSARQAERDGDPFRALVQYDEALRINPKHPRAGIARKDLRERLLPRIDELEARAKQYFQDEDLQNAVLTWRQVLLIQPKRESAAYNLARAERMLARLEEIQAGDRAP